MMVAKWENEGRYPNNSVLLALSNNADTRLIGLWSVIGASVVYETKDERSCEPNTYVCDQIFSTDPIAYDVLTGIIRRNASADMIKVHQLHNGACNTQSISDIQDIMEKGIDPQLILCAGSNFAVVLANAEYGIDVWVWDLRSTW